MGNDMAAYRERQMNRTARGSRRVAWLGAALLIAMGTAYADDAAAPASPSPRGEEMVRNELRQALVRLSAAGAFGDRAPGDVSMTVTLPAERFIDLGVLVDGRAPADDGVRVLGVTPGSGGASLGVRAGDVLTAVNGATLVGLGRDATGNATAVGVLKRTVDALPDSGTLQIDVRRNGAPMQLAGTVSARYLPALRLELGDGALVASTSPAAAASRVAAATSTASGEGCGRVSTFHVAPRSEHLYAVKLLQVDGRLPGTSLQETFRLSPGRHELLLSEQIDRRDLPDTFTRKRTEWGRKLLTVDVVAGETLLLAARLDDPRAATADYWAPVVWKSTAEPCR
jgi:hypothetical protein